MRINKIKQSIEQYIKRKELIGAYRHVDENGEGSLVVGVWRDRFGRFITDAFIHEDYVRIPEYLRGKFLKKVAFNLDEVCRIVHDAHLRSCQVVLIEQHPDRCVVYNVGHLKGNLRAIMTCINAIRTGQVALRYRGDFGQGVHYLHDETLEQFLERYQIMPRSLSC